MPTGGDRVIIEMLKIDVNAETEMLHPLQTQIMGRREDSTLRRYCIVVRIQQNIISYQIKTN